MFWSHLLITIKLLALKLKLGSNVRFFLLLLLCSFAFCDKNVLMNRKLICIWDWCSLSIDYRSNTTSPLELLIVYFLCKWQISSTLFSNLFEWAFPFLSSSVPPHCLFTSPDCEQLCEHVIPPFNNRKCTVRWVCNVRKIVHLVKRLLSDGSEGGEQKKTIPIIVWLLF